MHLWKKLNQGHDFVKITIPIPTNNESSLLTFLSEEYSEGIQLVQHIHKCFSTLNRITKKTMVAEPKDLQLANELLTLQVKLKCIHILSLFKLFDLFRHLKHGKTFGTVRLILISI